MEYNMNPAYHVLLRYGSVVLYQGQPAMIVGRIPRTKKAMVLRVPSGEVHWGVAVTDLRKVK
jgi:hypothetical protein